MLTSPDTVCRLLSTPRAQWGRAAYSSSGQKAGGQASHPANQPLIYEPWRPAGERYFHVAFNPIPRMYHSTACLHRT